MKAMMNKELLAFTGFARKYPRLPLALEGIGLRHAQEYVSRPSGIEAWQWIQCIDGSGELLLNDHTYAVEKGTGILLPAGCPHDYYSTCDRWITNFLCVNGALMEQTAELLNLNEAGVYYTARPQIIIDYEDQIFDLCRERAHEHTFEISKLLYSLLTDLSSDIVKSAYDTAQSQNDKINTAISYMYANYHHPLDLSDIASHLQVTREYLCQLFKKSTDSTVLEYLTGIRLAEAKTALMKYPDLTVKEISAACGFDSPSYFCYVFKKHEHLTPLQFRESRN